jgi:hypothetical protein
MSGEKAALDEAVKAARERRAVEARRILAQPVEPELLPPTSEDEFALTDEPGAVVPRGRGRPPGATNKRTDAMARLYIGRHGDPLEEGVLIAAMPILDDGVLEAFADRLGCSKHEAFKAWQSVFASVMPYAHQRLAALEVAPAGSFGGDPFDLGSRSRDASGDGEVAP